MIMIVMFILTDAEQAESEHPDYELIWNIHLLSQVCILILL